MSPAILILGPLLPSRERFASFPPHSHTHPGQGSSKTWEGRLGTGRGAIPRADRWERLGPRDFATGLNRRRDAHHLNRTIEAQV